WSTSRARGGAQRRVPRGHARRPGCRDLALRGPDGEETCGTVRVADSIPEASWRPLDDVVRDPDGAPRLLAVARGDEHARLGRGALGLVENAHFVVEEPHRPEVRVELLERLAQRVVERVDRPVAGRRGVLEATLDADADRRLGDRLRGVALLLDDHAIRV